KENRLRPALVYFDFQDFRTSQNLQIVAGPRGPQEGAVGRHPTPAFDIDLPQAEPLLPRSIGVRVKRILKLLCGVEKAAYQRVGLTDRCDGHEPASAMPLILEVEIVLGFLEIW